MRIITPAVPGAGEEPLSRLSICPNNLELDTLEPPVVSELLDLELWVSAVSTLSMFSAEKISPLSLLATWMSFSSASERLSVLR